MTVWPELRDFVFLVLFVRVRMGDGMNFGTPVLMLVDWKLPKQISKCCHSQLAFSVLVLGKYVGSNRAGVSCQR